MPDILDRPNVTPDNKNFIDTINTISTSKITQ